MRVYQTDGQTDGPNIAAFVAIFCILIST